MKLRVTPLSGLYSRILMSPFLYRDFLLTSTAGNIVLPFGPAIASGRPDHYKFNGKERNSESAVYETNEHLLMGSPGAKSGYAGHGDIGEDAGCAGRFATHGEVDSVGS